MSGPISQENALAAREEYDALVKILRERPHTLPEHHRYQELDALLAALRGEAS